MASLLCLIAFVDVAPVMTEKVSLTWSNIVWNHGESSPLDRVHMGPGKSWNFIMAFSRTGKSWKRVTGLGKFWTSVYLQKI